MVNLEEINKPTLFGLLAIAFFGIPILGEYPIPVSLFLGGIPLGLIIYNKMREKMEIAEAKNLSPHVVYQGGSFSFSTIRTTKNYVIIDGDGVNSTYKQEGDVLIVAPKLITFVLDQDVALLGKSLEQPDLSFMPLEVQQHIREDYIRFILIQENLGEEDIVLNIKSRARTFYKSELSKYMNMVSNLKDQLRIKKGVLVDAVDDQANIKHSLDERNIELPRFDEPEEEIDDETKFRR